MSDSNDACQSNNDESHFGLRIASIFIILVTSLIGTLAPVVLRRTNILPDYVFQFTKFYGSGVIICTAFMHLLAPAVEQLGSECLPASWRSYPWAPAIAMFAAYVIFFFEVAANRISTRRLGQVGLLSRVECATEPEPIAVEPKRVILDYNDPACCKTGECDTDPSESSLDISYDPSTSEGIAQIIAIAILECGILLHSVIIGLTLGISDEFVTLFIALVFHQLFEGLGLGSRLCALKLKRGWWWVPYVAGMAYALTTPVGVAAGVGTRAYLNGQAASMLAVAGVLDSLSAGIMLYSGLVILLGQEILLNPRMIAASLGRMAYALMCMSAGTASMAVIACWV